MCVCVCGRLGFVFFARSASGLNVLIVDFGVTDRDQAPGPTPLEPSRFGVVSIAERGLLGKPLRSHITVRRRISTRTRHKFDMNSTLCC